MPLLSALSRRRATRAFSATPVPPEVEETLWRAVSVAPSHGNTQATRILVARSAAVRAALEAALSDGNRQWAPAAPLMAAIATNPSHESVQTNSDGSVREMWAFNSGIATGNLLAQATALGVVAHPMAAFDEVAVRKAFGAPDDLRILAVVAIGYAGSPETLPADLQAREKAPQERLPLANLVVIDRWTPEHGISARELRRRPQA